MIPETLPLLQPPAQEISRLLAAYLNRIEYIHQYILFFTFIFIEV